ncbi:MAG: MBL fold metallo-hydrolase [Deltaproteobacteria bacterium]
MVNLPDNFIKFLGTAGARFVMIKQVRHSGGIWIRSNGTNVLIDPGPGSLVRCATSRPRLDPAQLDAIILTHRHLDHTGDINVMIEAMTEGGFKRRGTVFCPRDALTPDPVILKYLRSFPSEIRVMEPRKKYTCGSFTFETSPRHKHPVETYGLKFRVGGTQVGYMVDTGYCDKLFPFYKVPVLMVGVVLVEPRPSVFHLSVPEVRTIIGKIKPGETILTHFGMRMVKARPQVIAEQLSKELKRKVTAAYDGMLIEF